MLKRNSLKASIKPNNLYKIKVNTSFANISFGRYDKKELHPHLVPNGSIIFVLKIGAEVKYMEGYKLILFLAPDSTVCFVHYGWANEFLKEIK